jgi:hypothetical protein
MRPSIGRSTLFAHGLPKLLVPAFVTIATLFVPVQLGAGALVSSALAMAHPERAEAHTSHAFMLNESGDLHLISKHGFTLHERGVATGTVHGTIYVNLKIVSSSRVTAEVNIYPTKGSIISYGTATYKRERTSAVFSGSLAVERGSGNYSHAHGTGLRFSGTIQRTSEAITVHVSGRASD